MMLHSKCLTRCKRSQPDFESASRRRGRHFFLAYGGVAQFNTDVCGDGALHRSIPRIGVLHGSTLQSG